MLLNGLLPGVGSRCFVYGGQFENHATTRSQNPKLQRIMKQLLNIIKGST